MPNSPSAVAIYTRISSDIEGTSAGVTRRVDDCRKLAGDLGWTVAEVYVDNDVSAYRGLTPGFGGTAGVCRHPNRAPPSRARGPCDPRDTPTRTPGEPLARLRNSSAPRDWRL